MPDVALKRRPVPAARRTLRLMFGAAAIMAASSMMPASAQRAPAVIDLAPHRAVYEFTLGSARGGNAVSSLSGRMVYEFTGSACDGYTQTMRFVTSVAMQNGESSLSDQRSTSWEDAAGKLYRFQSSQFRNQKLAEQTAGTAERGTGDADVAVQLTHPDKRKVGIGARALFPVQHSIKLLEAARRGDNVFTADFYDGSEGGEKSYVITAIVGKRAAPSFVKGLPRVGQAAKLDSIPAWPVALSYFEHGAEKKDATPTYEMSFLFFENGVSRRLVIDNGEYAMKGDLSELVMLEQTPCKKK